MCYHGVPPVPTVHLGGAVSYRHGVRSALVNVEWVGLSWSVMMTPPCVHP